MLRPSALGGMLRPARHLAVSSRHFAAAACRFDHLGGEQPASMKGRLPVTLFWDGAKPSDEFPSLAAEISGTRGAELTRFTRLTHSILHAIARPESAAMLGLSIAAIYSVGLVEGSVVLKAGIWGADMPTAAHFLLRYAYEQTMVSAVWGMQDPVTIATAMGLEPAAVLRPSIATGVAPSEPECARGLLQVTGLCAVRSLIATTLFLSQTTFASELRQLAETRPRHVRDAACAVSRRVRLGREPLFPGIEQRIIRLCGRQSDVTEVSLLRYGPHIVPVFERPAAVATLIHAHSRALREPVYWQADLTNSEASLALSAKQADLTMEDASQAFLRIRRAARLWQRSTPQAKPFRNFRVVLGNPRAREAERTRTLRERIDRLHQDTS
ncbi:hypothetical protein EMIHUDRAFT_457938 [Emiliania huxleyi CCMP1516]|uniref:Uncharacterized protein n=2 Tax=Emiliania huxleyi TaxID=2903 RepID=A0A0D3JJE5_EMIH1|nr:hypothetical protein EMIHUDRAFT_450922 [Emiliania huxleyi CCMP1516]XP_005776059.1 hypothetical protein EMIHUDRAFT_457938 [Emiliania huxleyi CCMP1516]EOD20415.1 hypothetical protein EMIHUDRAFT_450922 [Emiliania huxleyi CCMP1516]EOD23630.1 hypothetical protein EMIHUDRAFT_457938 [Emiliania huxleyi CCMP1516]|eukprot:XP_005772844.1 hypothetical protein EMIHUDRAFT_450922 [Emiliania huxleyi CCMP1516]